MMVNRARLDVNIGKFSTLNLCVTWYYWPIYSDISLDNRADPVQTVTLEQPWKEQLELATIKFT